MAVSDTVGLGNITGTVGLGGSGATFWMIVCGLIGISSKFVECTLGVKYIDTNTQGIVYCGSMHYLKKSLGEMGYVTFGKILGVLFTILCVGASFGGRNDFSS